MAPDSIVDHRTVWAILELKVLFFFRQPCAETPGLGWSRLPCAETPGGPRCMPAHRGQRSELRQRVRIPAWARELVAGFRLLPVPELRQVLSALRWLLTEVQHLIDVQEGETELDRLSDGNARAALP